MLEIIGFTPDGCLGAQHAGAQRIELCDNPMEGGTTPSYGFIKTARKILTIDLFPIIRPRGGDFVYSKEEFEVMIHDLEIAKELGCDGIVSGVLLTDGNIDVKRTKLLVELSYPLEFTFHRAFDRVADPVKALETLIDIGVTRILTSGLKPDAVSGTAMLKKLVKKADDRVIIMPGSGVNASNILQLKQETGAKEFHSSARIKQSSKMEYKNPAMKETMESYTVDEKEIRKMALIVMNDERGEMMNDE